MESKMRKVQPKDGESTDIVAANIERLKELFPDAFTEGGVNFGVLRQLLGDASVLDEGDEKYGLNWHGKKRARQIALTPSMGTLLPCPDESVDWETTKNLFIEGDNLEVLKLLQKSYANKVKMIYIDPPYNTGKEFIYPDKFQDNLDTYLKYTGQVDSECMKLSSNTETSGRKHTNWLSMMYPRLRLARNLLSKDGVIFISIDDNEYSNLKQICDEIFGSNNFLSSIVWHKKYAASNDAKGIPAMHDYILVYQKSEGFKRKLLPRTDKQNSLYKYDSKDGKGKWRPDNLTVKTVSESYLYEIVNPNTGKAYKPPQGRCWLTSEKRMKEWIEESRVFFGQKGDGAPQLKRYLAEVQDGVVPTTYWSYEEVGHTDSSRKELKRLFKTSAPFDNPKPTALLKKMFYISLGDEDIVLDFFAGSCSTAHAMLDFNSENKKSHRFIMVQLPEPCPEKSDAFKAGYKLISDVGKDRIRKAGQILMESSFQDDVGFRVFKLNSSNLNVWNPDRSDMVESLLSHADHLVEGRTEQDVLCELLLKRGVDLAVPIENRVISGKTIYSIGYGVLFACLDESITREQVEVVGQGIVEWYRELEPSSDTHVFFRDSAFRDDVSKTNMVAILEQNGITHVRSL